MGNNINGSVNKKDNKNLRYETKTVKIGPITQTTVYLHENEDGNKKIYRTSVHFNK